MRRSLALLVLPLFLFTVGCFRSSHKFIESGDAYLKRGQLAEAEIEYRNAVQNDRNSAEAHYRLGLAEIKLGNLENAIKELERVVELAPSDIQARLDLGNLQFAVSDLELADQTAFAVLEKDSTNAEAYSLRANVAEARGKHSEAISDIEKSIALKPSNASFYLTRGIFESNAGTLDAAEKSYRKSVELDAKNEIAIKALGEVLERQQNWADAKNLFQQWILSNPKSVTPRLELAKLYLARREKDAAERVLIQAQIDLHDDPAAYKLLPEFYQTIGENDKALALLKSLHSKYPSDPKIASEYARTLYIAGEFETANELNEQILKQNARDLDSLILKCNILEHQGHVEEAVAILRTVVTDEPASAAAHFALGSALSQGDDKAGAEKEWRTAAQLQPDMVEVQRALARLAIDNMDGKLLRQSSQRIVEDDPQSPDGYVFRGIAEMGDKQADKVESDLGRAMQIAPRNPLGFAKMCEWRLTQKRYAEAEKLCEQALEHDPNFSEALRTLVAVYSAEKQPARSLARVHAQLAKAPQNSEYYLVLAGLQSNDNDLRGAEASLQKAIDLNQNNMDAFLMLGQVQVKEGSLESAIASSHRWMEKNPKDVRAYVLSGSLEEARGNWQIAQDLYWKALSIQHEYPLAENNLAYSMLENGGNNDVALSLAQKAHTALPKVATIDDTLAWAYYHKGIYKMAIGLLQDALKLEPENALYHYHIGMAYSKIDNYVDAKSHLRRALEIEPSSAQAEVARKQLENLGG